jgi:hypothetical protein
VDLNEELEIRHARIRELEARDRVREQLRHEEAEADFWAKVERTLYPEPSAKERYQQQLFERRAGPR